MYETFIIIPTMTDEDILKGISQKTKFVLLDDHVNGQLTGSNIKQYLQGKSHLLYQLISEYPECLFILDNGRPGLENYDNVMWLPTSWLWFPAMVQDDTNFLVDWRSRRKFTVNYMGGQNRINRILLEHWIAKHLPSNQFVHTKKEDSTLHMIEDVIRLSNFANKKHFDLKKNLRVNWIPYKAGQNWLKRFKIEIESFIPMFKLNSYLALITEAQDPCLNNTLSEKTWLSMMGGNLILQFGNYKILETYKKLGLESFDNVFDNTHLISTDRYYQTIGGCENNRDIILNHSLVESLWHENLPALQHNFNLAKDINHWLHVFEKPFRIISDALTLNKNIEPQMVTQVSVDRFRHEFKL